jgi:hypothetical protein
MLRDLLHEILGEAWVDLLDLTSATRVPTTFTSRSHKRRESDLIWRLRRKDNGEPVYVYILLEFQSKPDPYMAVRLMTYIGLFFEYLIREGLLPESGKLPLVIPVVLYNGSGEWPAALELAELIERLDPSAELYVPRLRYRLIHEAKVPLELLETSDSPVADLFRIERSTDWKEVVGSFGRLRRHIGDDDSLRHTFVEWIFKEVFPRLDVPLDQMPERLSLEGVETMLAERIEEWNRKLAEDNLQKGRQEGLLEGRREGEAQALLRLLEKKFGALPKRAQSRIAKAELTRLSEWFDRAVTAERLDEVFDA